MTQQDEHKTLSELKREAYIEFVNIVREQDGRLNGVSCDPLTLDDLKKANCAEAMFDRKRK